VASLSQGRTAAAQCGLFTHKSVPVIFKPPCILRDAGNATESFLYEFSLWTLTVPSCHFLKRLCKLTDLRLALATGFLSSWYLKHTLSLSLSLSLSLWQD